LRSPLIGYLPIFTPPKIIALKASQQPSHNNSFLVGILINFTVKKKKGNTINLLY